MRSLEFSLERLGIDRDRHPLRARYRRLHPRLGSGARRACRRLMAGGYKALRQAARREGDQGLRRRRQRMAGVRDAGRAGRFRPVPAGRALHAAGTGGARTPSCRSARSAASASCSAGPIIPAFSPPGRSPAPLQLRPRAEGTFWTASRRSRRCARRHKVKLAAGGAALPAHPPGGGVGHSRRGRAPKKWRSTSRRMSAKIPKALWQDLKAQGLMHADAPVPK